MTRTNTCRHRRRDSQSQRIPQLRKHVEHPARRAVVARIRARDDQIGHREQRVWADGRQQHREEGVGPVCGTRVYGGH